MAGAIFSGNINARATAWMMIYMLIFAVLWEFGCNWLSRRCEDNRAHTELLSKVAKELMILGFIAFAVILCKELKILKWNTETLLTFEFCDLLVSITVLIFCAHCWVSSMAMAWIEQKWDRLSMSPTSAVMRAVDDYKKKVDSSKWAAFVHWFPLTRSQWRHEADFKILQLLFKSKFELPPSFDYVQYIQLVLQGVVVSMANITTLHWVLIMFINFVWWVAIAAGAGSGTSDDGICLFKGPADCVAEDHRRLAGDEGGCGNYTGNSTKYDISADETRDWLWFYLIIGWLIVLFQWLIVHNIEKRTRKVLASNGATDDDHTTCRVLDELEQDRAEHEDHVPQHAAHIIRTVSGITQKDLKRSTSRGGSVSEPTKHHRHLIELGETFEDGEVDQVMVFKDGTDANGILSLHSFEVLVFISQLFQLVVDFYLGFYIVHIRKRVGLAGVGGLSQFFFHVAFLAAIFMVLYLLMTFTRNIALLVGVLHLNEKAVSDVLQHMELVKSIRQRIHETLANTKIVHGIARPEEAAQKLENAEKGEVAILKLLGAKGKKDRVTSAEIQGMVKDHKEHMTMTEDDLKNFLGACAVCRHPWHLPFRRCAVYPRAVHRPRGVRRL